MPQAPKKPSANVCGFAIWLTGLSGAGKTTIAHALQRHFSSIRMRSVVLDGDVLRKNLCSDLSFSPEDRMENIRRASAVATMLVENGFVCIVALISPYARERSKARMQFRPGEFIEVYVNAPLDICESRDPKGLYARARNGELLEFTGVSAPYEVPVAPEVTVRTDLFCVDDCVRQILDALKEHSKRDLGKRQAEHLSTSMTEGSGAS